MQTHSVAPERDWMAARDYVAHEAKHDELVAFAPRWADPLGRRYFGSEIATLEREAIADESGFARAFVVGIRGATLNEFAGWHKTDERRFGRVTVTTWANPSLVPVIEDLVSMATPARMRVTQGDRDCPFSRSSVQSGGLGFGPAVPGDRFGCASGGFVGVSVVADLDYVPHRCLYAPPTAGTATRLIFLGVRFGRTLSGHHALYVEAERARQGAPVTIRFSVGGESIGTETHRDGDGWSGFALDTSRFAGKTADLVAEITSSGERRMYCFEAGTR